MRALIALVAAVVGLGLGPTLAHATPAPISAGAANTAAGFELVSKGKGGAKSGGRKSSGSKKSSGGKSKAKKAKFTWVKVSAAAN